MIFSFTQNILQTPLSEEEIQGLYGCVSSTLKSTDVIPVKYTLMQNFPNPFNPSTNISYSLPNTSNVSLKIYNMLGEEITTLVNKQQTAGRYKVNFDATSISGGLSSGVYFYRIQAIPLSGSDKVFVETKKLLLLK